MSYPVKAHIRNGYSVHAYTRGGHAEREVARKEMWNRRDKIDKVNAKDPKYKGAKKVFDSLSWAYGELNQWKDRKKEVPIERAKAAKLAAKNGFASTNEALKYYKKTSSKIKANYKK